MGHGNVFSVRRELDRLDRLLKVDMVQNNTSSNVNKKCSAILSFV